jgi:signal transduction histidine kinase
MSRSTVIPPTVAAEHTCEDLPSSDGSSGRPEGRLLRENGDASARPAMSSRLTAATPAAVPVAGRNHRLSVDRVIRQEGTAERSVARATSDGHTRFAAYVAHELRQPLATQCALLELALGDPNANVASWQEIGWKVLGACRQQERMLEACLTLARSQGRAPRRQPVDLGEIAAKALGAYGHCGLERIVVLKPARTTGDPDLLERLAANIISNAIRHNIPGGHIKAETRTEPGRAVLAVANTGPLIPAGELTRLFLPFQRLNSNAATSRDGFGLGLPIVQAIADAHGATLTARPRPSGGLEVDIGFPAIL